MNSCQPYLLWSLVGMFVFFKYIFMYFFYVAIHWALVIATAIAAYHVLCYGGKLPKPAVQELLDVIDWDLDTGAILFDPLTNIIAEGLLDESSYPFVGSVLN